MTQLAAQPLFTGVGVALATLFSDDGEVDVPATAEHSARLVDLGVKAIVVAGSTGEAAALDADERSRLLAAVRKRVSGVPVLAGTGAPSARQAVALTRRAVDEGADGLLVLSPPRTANPTAYYEQVAAAAGDVPVLAYHFPASSAPGIAVEHLPGLPVAGVKDSSGDPTRLLATLDVFDRPVYVGSAAILALAGPLGCAGAILALANAEPERCVAAFDGDAKAQRDLTAAHLASQKAFPHGLKQLMAQRFATATNARVG